MLEGESPLNEDIGERIYREQLEQKQELKGFGLALNAHNLEVARMSIELKHLTEQQGKIVEAQNTLAQHDRRLLTLEAQLANNEKVSARLAENTRWLIALAITSGLSILAVVMQYLQSFKAH
jgi:uncharacterized coiled-coil protein SlyX